MRAFREGCGRPIPAKLSRLTGALRARPVLARAPPAKTLTVVSAVRALGEFVQSRGGWLARTIMGSQAYEQVPDSGPPGFLEAKANQGAQTRLRGPKSEGLYRKPLGVDSPRMLDATIAQKIKL